MSEWNSKNKPGVKSRDPEYPDLTTDFVDPYNDNNQYKGKDNLVGWYRFLGNGAVGRVDGGTTNTFPNMAKTGSDGQALTTSGSLGSAVYYEQTQYGAAVTYKAHYQSPFDGPASGWGIDEWAATPSQKWDNSFNQQVTPYLPTNMANGALPFSGSKAEKNYFRITDTDGWNIYSSGAEFSVAVWIRMNDYQNGQQQGDSRFPIVTKVKNGADWDDGGEFALTWIPASITSCNLRGYVMDDDGNVLYARSGYFNENSSTNKMDSTTYPEPLAEVPPNGSWVHVVMTWNGTNTDSGTTKPSSNSTDAVKMYINGHFMTYDNYWAAPQFDGNIRPATNSTCGDILINCGRDDDSPTTAGKYTNQDIAEAAFWSKCLSPKEIKALYHGTTQGIKKWDTGLVKNPARPQLQRLDDTSGTAYPTTGGSAEQDKLGKRTPHFDDTLTRVFTQSAESIYIGTRMRVSDKLLSASFSTPNTPPTLKVSVTGHSTYGVDSKLIANLPFLTASVTEFKDPYTPFSDSAIYMNDSPFYATGSLSTPGFNTRLGNKVQIVINTNPQIPTRIGTISNSEQEQWYMAYWNKDRSVWEKIGRGIAFPSAPTPGTVKTADQLVPMEDTDAPDYVAYTTGTPGFLEGVAQRNTNFACIGFLGHSPKLAIGWRKSTADGGNGSDYHPVNEIVMPSMGMPTDQMGFPFDARYHATSSQQINMSDYIDAPFLLEKMVVHYSSSHELAGSGLYNRRAGQYQATYDSSGETNPGKPAATTTKQWAKNMNFFILRQRKGKFQHVHQYVSGRNYKAAGGQSMDTHTQLTSSIPGKRVTNQDGTNKQDCTADKGDGDSREWVYDTRDLVTYSQHIIAGDNNAGGSVQMKDYGGGMGHFMSAGLSRDLDTYYPLSMQRGGSTDAYGRSREKGWWVSDLNDQMTGSFIISSSCRTTPIIRIGARGDTFGTSQQMTKTYPFALGGRSNPNNILTDRRGFVKSLPTGLTSSEGWMDTSRAGGSPRNTALTASARSTFENIDSPYILDPGDVIIIGAQSDFQMRRINSWPGSFSGADGYTGESDYWDNSKPGWNTEICPGEGKVVLYGSYLKNHRAAPPPSAQQLTTVGVHSTVSGPPVYDQWEIDIKEAYSGSYLDEAITGSMTNPPTGWPRAPAVRQQSLWASASSTPIPGHRWVANSLYRDRGGAFDGSIKPWVSSSAYHSSSVHGMYFGTSMLRGSGICWVGAEGGAPFEDQAGMEPTSTREVSATAFLGNGGDIFGFQRNVRLTCPEETYYDSMVPDPGVCWGADNQPRGWAGGNIEETIAGEDFVTLGIGASNGGNQAGVSSDGGSAKYTNEWWLPSFPFEARYRGFSQPPADAFKRKIEQNSVYRVQLCLPSFGATMSPSGSGGVAPRWVGFDPLGEGNPAKLQTAKLAGVVAMYIDGKKPGISRNTQGDNWGGQYTTADSDMEGTVLPVLFGFGIGLSGSVEPYKRRCATGRESAIKGNYKYISNKPSGCKYGLYSWVPRVTSTIFRSSKFGQFRDMLEQRRYSRFYIQSDGAVEINAPVVCQFKEPAWLAPTEDTDKSAVSTQCSNLSLFATSSVPYFDGEVKNRGPLIADGSDTIVIE